MCCKLLGRGIAEALGTFGLVLVGCGAIMLDARTEALGNFGVSLAFGGIVTLMILLFARVSGAHINPAVTLALWIAGRTNGKDLLAYTVAQLVGAMLAMPVLLWFFPGAMSFGETLPKAGVGLSFTIEILLSLFLMLVIFYCVESKHSVPRLALLVGAAVGLDAFLGGPLTGASMNPARSIAPAIASGNTADLWIYILAPMIGTAAAAALWTRTDLPKLIT